MDKNYSYTELSNRLTKRSSVKIENNTIAYKVPDTTRINIDLHNNTIAQLTESTIILSSCGWLTSTTKDRLNKIIPYPYQINQSNGQWFIYNVRLIQRPTIGLFTDGLTFEYSTIMHGWIIDKATMGQDNTALRKSILKYCKGYMTALKRGEIELPSNGDCLYCQFHTEDGKSMGESMHDTSHLKSHIEESYYVPSLLWNAVQSYPVSQMGSYAIQCLMTGESLHDNLSWIIDQQVYNSLKKYMFKSFGLPT